VSTSTVQQKAKAEAAAAAAAAREAAETDPSPPTLHQPPAPHFANQQQQQQQQQQGLAGAGRQLPAPMGRPFQARFCSPFSEMLGRSSLSPSSASLVSPAGPCSVFVPEPHLWSQSCS